MSIFRRRSESRSDDNSYGIRTWSDLAAIVSGSGGKGRSITVSEALFNSTVWACVDVLSTSISEAPIDVVRNVGKARIPVAPAPAIVDSPSAVTTADVWRYQLAASLVTDGNAFGRIVNVDSAGFPTQVELLDPSTVTTRIVRSGVPTVTIDGKEEQLYPHGDIWHVPGKVVLAGSPFALSPIRHAGAAINISQAAEEFVSEFFAGGGHPTALLRAKVADLTQAEADMIKVAWRKATRAGSREPVVVGEDLDYETIQATVGEAKSMEMIRLQVEQICRYFFVPPSMVYAAISGQNVTYTNLAQADTAYLKRSLNGLFVRIEHAYGAILRPATSARFNRSAVLRMDPEGRWKIYDLRLRNKTIAVNEIRALEDEEPFPDPAFDLPGIPGSTDTAPTPDPEV